MEREDCLEHCTLCPRNCGANRIKGKQGYCKETAQLRLARAALHMWEEPCISGKSGSGAVFFSGCGLQCVFCQNHKIANGEKGKVISKERLAEIFLELQEQGANNVNLVTADHYIPFLIPAIESAKQQGLKVPVIYNTGSYVKAETIRALEGMVDVYLPDFKYFEKEIGVRYAKVSDYRETAMEAIAEMVRQTGNPVFLEKGTGKILDSVAYNAYEGEEEVLICKGVIVRHLLLPEQKKDSKAIVKYLLQTYGTDIYISLLNQYTPMYIDEKYPELQRKVTTEEYEEVVGFAIENGIENGFVQEGETALESFIPDFDYQGL